MRVECSQQCNVTRDASDCLLIWCCCSRWQICIDCLPHSLRNCTARLHDRGCQGRVAFAGADLVSAVGVAIAAAVARMDWIEASFPELASWEAIVKQAAGLSLQ
jgi:hypothetical protein